MNKPSPPPELHLPDLPEVAVQLGSAPLGPEVAGPRQGLSWRYRVQQAVSSYLPLLLMGLLAASTWWLVKNTPQAPAPPGKSEARQTPDYSMEGFSVTRFGPDGRVVLRIDGDQLRHFPATDRMEIDGVRIHAIAPDGRTTDATARKAVANGDATEVQLIGGAQVLSQNGGRDRLEVRSEFLHAFVRFERLRSHLPVQVIRSGSDIRAGGLEYDHLQGLMQLQGPVRALFTAGPPQPATPSTTPLPPNSP